MDLEITFDIWFDILFGTWEYLLNTVGVGHLGSTRSGGSAFYSYHWDSSVVTMVGAFLSTFTFILFMDHYDGWLYFMMDVISFMMDGCIMYGGWFHLFYCTCIMDPKRMMYFWFSYVYSFNPFIPYDMYSGWMRILNLICQEAFIINVYYGLWTFNYSFMWM